MIFRIALEPRNCAAGEPSFTMSKTLVTPPEYRTVLDETLIHASRLFRMEDGGARRDRTDDLMLAKHALSQLSYGPVPEDECSALDQSGGPGKT